MAKSYNTTSGWTPEPGQIQAEAQSLIQGTDDGLIFLHNDTRLLENYRVNRCGGIALRLYLPLEREMESLSRQVLPRLSSVMKNPNHIGCPPGCHDGSDAG